jgi:hypothetical protein
MAASPEPFRTAIISRCTASPTRMPASRRCRPWRRRNDFDGQPRVLPGELGEDRRERHLERDAWHVDPQKPRHLAAVRGIFSGLVDVCQRRLHACEEARPSFRQGDAALGAHELGFAETVFQRPHGVAHGGRTYAERGRSRCGAAIARHAPMTTGRWPSRSRSIHASYRIKSAGDAALTGQSRLNEKPALSCSRERASLQAEGDFSKPASTSEKRFGGRPPRRSTSPGQRCRRQPAAKLSWMLTTVLIAPGGRPALREARAQLLHRNDIEGERPVGYLGHNRTAFTRAANRYDFGSRSMEKNRAIAAAPISIAAVRAL